MGGASTPSSTKARVRLAGRQVDATNTVVARVGERGPQPVRGGAAYFGGSGPAPSGSGLRARHGKRGDRRGGASGGARRGHEARFAGPRLALCQRSPHAARARSVTIWAMPAARSAPARRMSSTFFGRVRSPLAERGPPRRVLQAQVQRLLGVTVAVASGPVALCHILAFRVARHEAPQREHRARVGILGHPPAPLRRSGSPSHGTSGWGRWRRWGRRSCSSSTSSSRRLCPDPHGDADCRSAGGRCRRTRR